MLNNVIYFLGAMTLAVISVFVFFAIGAVCFAIGEVIQASRREKRGK